MKRFEYICFDGFTDNGEYIMPHEVATLLNEYDEENRELKEFIRNLTNYKGEILLLNGRAYKREYVERLLE